MQAATTRANALHTTSHMQDASSNILQVVGVHSRVCSLAKALKKATPNKNSLLNKNGSGSSRTHPTPNPERLNPKAFLATHYSWHYVTM